jgi:hypothetical protein
MMMTTTMRQKEDENKKYQKEEEKEAEKICLILVKNSAIFLYKFKCLFWQNEGLFIQMLHNLILYI